MKKNVRSRRRALRQALRSKKTVTVIYLVLRALVIATLVLQFLNGNFENVFLCGLTLVLCCGFAWTFRWFPLENAGAWASFMGIFFLSFLVLCLGFELYFRAAGKKYDALLGRWRAKGGDEEEK